MDASGEMYIKEGMKRNILLSMVLLEDIDNKLQNMTS